MKIFNKYAEVEFEFDGEKYSDRVIITFLQSETSCICNKDEIEQLYGHLRGLYED